jgi:hypothetical protein
MKLKEILQTPKSLPFKTVGARHHSNQPLTRLFSVSQPNKAYQEEAAASVGVGPDGEYQYGIFDKNGAKVSKRSREHSMT